MGGKHSEHLASHSASLNDFMVYYNYNRYPCRLYGKKPMQIVEGEDIDKTMFSEILSQAKVNRLEVNKNFNECVAKIGCNKS